MLLLIFVTNSNITLYYIELCITINVYLYFFIFFSAVIMSISPFGINKSLQILRVDGQHLA